jgi:hypothetical protein
MRSIICKLCGKPTAYGRKGAGKMKYQKGFVHNECFRLHKAAQAVSSKIKDRKASLAQTKLWRKRQNGNNKL